MKVTPRPLTPGDKVQLAEAGVVMDFGVGRYVKVAFPSIGEAWVKREDLVRVGGSDGE